MNTWRNASLAVTAVALLALTTACGQEKGTASPNGQAVGNAAPAQQPADSGYGSDGGYGSDAGAGRAPKEAGQLAVWDSKKLGKVLTDSEGFTLYRFDKDTAEPPKSNCEGDCAKAWPAVPAENAEAAAGRRRVTDRRGHQRRRHQAADRRRAGRCTATRRTPSPATPTGRASAALGSPRPRTERRRP